MSMYAILEHSTGILVTNKHRWNNWEQLIKNKSEQYGLQLISQRPLHQHLNVCALFPQHDKRSVIDNVESKSPHPLLKTFKIKINTYIKNQHKIMQSSKACTNEKGLWSCSNFKNK